MNKNKKRFNNYSKNYNSQKMYHVLKEDTLLNFLLNNIKGESRNSIKGLLSHNLVSVNGTIIRQFDYPLAVKDEIIILNKPSHNTKNIKATLNIVYEDDELIVINKPSGLLSVSSDKEKGKTAYRLISDYLLTKDKHLRPYVVHRIDEDTSGILLMVKSKTLQDEFTNKWNDLVLDRGYYAICEGIFNKKEGTIKTYLKSNNLNLMYSSNDKVHGKLAITHYKVIKENDLYSLLDVHIDTGRKNQIRVAMNDMGHTIIGDDKYGEPSNSLKRLGLHAYRLKIKHPFTNKIYNFESKIPNEFLNLLKK